MKLTPRAQLALATAKKFAISKKSNYIATEHLLFGVCSASVEFVVDLQKLSDLVQEYEISYQGSNVPHTPRVKKALAIAEKLATQVGDDMVDTPALLAALIKEAETYGNDSGVVYILSKLGVDYKKELEIFLAKEKPVSTKETVSYELTPAKLEDLPGKSVKLVTVTTTKKAGITYGVDKRESGFTSDKVVTRLQFTDNTFYEFRT